MIVATRYEDVAKTIVHKLKFERAGAASGPIARLMAAQLGRYLARRSSSGLRSNLTYAVVHAPTAHRRVRQRGYDQAARLAKRIACIHGLPYRSVLMRRGNTRQVGADKKKRRNQMQQAFYISRQGNCENTHALLVDDVLTTGATLESAANTLKQAGAGRVTAVVFAMAGVSTREDH